MSIRASRKAKKVLAGVLSLSLLVLNGCGFAYRHPVATKVTLITAGAVGGLALAKATAPGKCPSMINGYPYNGSPPCPTYWPPDPSRRSK